MTRADTGSGRNSQDELERLRAEIAHLRESEKMFRISAEISGRLVWSTDPSGRLAEVSRIFRSLTGISSEELRARWTESVHPDDRERVLGEWAKSLSSGEPYSAEFRGQLDDGTTRWVKSRAVPFRDDEGNILGWYGSTEDIHEERAAEGARREAEQRLRESEALHRITLELSQQIAWSVEPDGTGITFSQRYYDFTGMTDDEEPLLSVHPDERDRMTTNWERSLATGQPYDEECRLKAEDGEYRLFRVRAMPLRENEGEIVRWYGISEEIHDEALAERRRREVEERYRLAVQATNDAVWDYDVANDAIEWSENSAAILGTGDSPIGRTSLAWWKQRIHPEDRGRVGKSFLKAMAGKDLRWSGAYRFLRGDGVYADMLDRGFIIRDADGQAVRAVGAMADLTDRLRAEKEISRMQAELIHVSRLSAMGTMASTLAHEINQPLSALSNYVGGARHLASEMAEVGAPLVAALEAAAASAERAGEIVRRVRDLVSRGRATIRVENLPNIIREANVLALVDERALGISHRLELDPKAEWVSADRVQIEQVLINLIRNAVDAMAESPRREIVISTEATGGCVEVSVADTGTGIAPELMDELFSQFMTTKSSGLGIGLPISRTIVELHGGKIWAENRGGSGACFTFTLPVPPEGTVE